MNDIELITMLIQRDRRYLINELYAHVKFSGNFSQSQIDFMQTLWLNIYVRGL